MNVGRITPAIAKSNSAIIKYQIKLVARKSSILPITMKPFCDKVYVKGVSYHNLFVWLQNAFCEAGRLVFLIS